MLNYRKKVIAYSLFYMLFYMRKCDSLLDMLNCHYQWNLSFFKSLCTVISQVIRKILMDPRPSSK